MTYTTQSELEDHYGTSLLVDLTDRAEVATGGIDAVVVAQAIDDAAGEINGYLKAKYVLPIDGIPDPLGVLARRMAIYNLHVYEPSAKITRDYERAIATLKDISKGLVKLDAAGVAPKSSGAGGAQVTDRERPMTAENMKGFI
ncbi:MAG: gp436 family protein [Pelagimonas sp.]|uniref:gp436 family protein n=1 Tax=Pelagimonas sp. TaxID=2073170 RepID=UPI003D6C4410